MEKHPVDKMIEFLQSPEGKASIEEFAKEQSEKHQRKCDFFESEKFNLIFDQIQKYLNDNPEDRVQQDDYTEFCIEDILTNQDFSTFIDSLFSVKESDSYSDDEYWMFSNENINYKGVIFAIVFGQGSFYSARLSEHIPYHKN